ncbi:IS3 family transposase [Micromonospora chersina]|uniref:IS3 family transposase n=1 Tax=Micromonospora chersina TaxID=47854 RepID=UPI003405A395
MRALAPPPGAAGYQVFDPLLDYAHLQRDDEPLPAAVWTTPSADWRGRPVSPRKAANQALGYLIGEIHQVSRGTYGSPRVHAELRLAAGVRSAANGWSGSCAVPACRASTGSGDVAALCGTAGVAAGGSGQPPVRRQPAGRVWVTDITQHRTQNGWGYWAVVLDVFAAGTQAGYHRVSVSACGGWYSAAPAGTGGARQHQAVDGDHGNGREQAHPSGVADRPTRAPVGAVASATTNGSGRRPRRLRGDRCDGDGFRGDEHHRAFVRTLAFVFAGGNANDDCTRVYGPDGTNWR